MAGSIRALKRAVAKSKFEGSKPQAKQLINKTGSRTQRRASLAAIRNFEWREYLASLKS